MGLLPASQAAATPRPVRKPMPLIEMPQFFWQAFNCINLPHPDLCAPGFSPSPRFVSHLPLRLKG